MVQGCTVWGLRGLSSLWGCRGMWGIECVWMWGLTGPSGLGGVWCVV